MAKRVRRSRRQEAAKQKVSVPVAEVPEAEAVAVSPTVNGTRASGTANIAQAAHAMMFNLADEYYHVYQELRNILIVTAVMIVVMIGLSFII